MTFTRHALMSMPRHFEPWGRTGMRYQPLAHAAPISNRYVYRKDEGKTLKGRTTLAHWRGIVQVCPKWDAAYRFCPTEHLRRSISPMRSNTGFLCAASGYGLIAVSQIANEMEGSPMFPAMRIFLIGSSIKVWASMLPTGSFSGVKPKRRCGYLPCWR